MASALRIYTGNDYRTYIYHFHDSYRDIFVVTEPGFNAVAKYVYMFFDEEYSSVHPVLAEITPIGSNIWEEFTADISIPDGVGELYFKFVGGGTHQFKGFTLG